MFHSLDKVTSTAIHVLPTILCYVQRWLKKDGPMCSGGKGSPETCAPFVWSRDVIAFPLMAYLVWQVFYIIITEVIERKVFEADYNVMTSLRWITRDRKNPMTMGVTAICRKLGIFERGEFFDSETWKTKGIFWTSQFIYTAATISPVKLLFDNFVLNTVSSEFLKKKVLVMMMIFFLIFFLLGRPFVCILLFYLERRELLL